jgi:two-component system, OmpR family, alkaline phosphatase synthesis response regulator PhoP
MSDAKPLKIYVVDDDAQIVEFMTVVLEAAGHTVFADISAVFAISRIVEKKPDCLITDLMMSELDGIELCKHLRGRDELKNLMIIFVSAQGSDYWKQRALDAGANGYIVKPLRADTFVNEVEGIIDAAAKSENKPPPADPDGQLPGRR